MLMSLYDSIDCGKIHHILIDEDTGKIVGYGISNGYYPWEVLKIDDDCLKETDDEITKKEREDLEDKFAYIEVVEILPEYRGQGLGENLLVEGLSKIRTSIQFGFVVYTRRRWILVCYEFSKHNRMVRLLSISFFDEI